MLNKKETKDIQSLGHKKYRDESKLFIAEGPKLIQELLTSVPAQIVKIYALKEWEEANQHKVHQTTIISEQELQRISQLHTPNQVLALLNYFPVVQPSPGLFTLYLDTIQDPGNLGTIIRIADWFNIKQIVCSKGCADLYNSKVVQSSMGSIARVNVYYDEGSWLADQKDIIYAATLNGAPLHEVGRTMTGVLLIGNESKGVSEELLQLADKQITISRKGKAESLNAAVATGIILSHILA